MLVCSVPLLRSIRIVLVPIVGMCNCRVATQSLANGNPSLAYRTRRNCVVKLQTFLSRYSFLCQIMPAPRSLFTPDYGLNMGKFYGGTCMQILYQQFGVYAIDAAILELLWQVVISLILDQFDY